MSAHIVPKAQIDLMVTGIIEGTRDGIVPPLDPSNPYNFASTPDALGQMLMTECVKSVEYRYPPSPPGSTYGQAEHGLPGPTDEYYRKPYRHEDHGYRPTAVELYGCIRNYGYQSCEHTGWEASESRALCDSIEQRIESSTTEAQRDHSPWGMDLDEIAICHAKLSDEGRALLAAVKASPQDATPVLSDWLQEREYLDGPLDIYPSTLLEMLWDIEVPKLDAPILDRNEAIARIKKALKERSGKSWSVTGGRGTAWGWIKIDAPPKRCTWQWVQTTSSEPPTPDAVYCGSDLTPPHRCDLGTERRITCIEEDPWSREALEAGRTVYFNWEVNRPGEKFGHMAPEERAELAELLGLSRPVHFQGESIPAGGNYRAEYVARAEGRTPVVHGVQYWD